MNYNVELFFTTATIGRKTWTITVLMNLMSWPNHPSSNHGTWQQADWQVSMEEANGSLRPASTDIRERFTSAYSLISEEQDFLPVFFLPFLLPFSPHTKEDACGCVEATT